MLAADIWKVSVLLMSFQAFAVYESPSHCEGAWGIRTLPFLQTRKLRLEGFTGHTQGHMSSE